MARYTIKAMKTGRILLTALAVALVILLVMFLGGVFQRLLIAGARMAQDMGDTVIITDEDEIGGEEALQTPETVAVTTWPPGDDPSWSEDMPLVPVDQTADELAEEMKTRESGANAP